MGEELGWCQGGVKKSGYLSGRDAPDKRTWMVVEETGSVAVEEGHGSVSVRQEMDGKGATGCEYLPEKIARTDWKR